MLSRSSPHATASTGFNPGLWITDALHRISFGRKVRTDVWKLISRLIKTPESGSGGMELSVALAKVGQIYAKRGNRSVEHIMLDLRQAVTRGDFAERAAYWSPGAEVILFSAYGRTEDTWRIFDGASVIARNEARISNAVRSALLSPTLVLIVLVGLMFVLGYSLFPSVELLAPVAEWPLQGRILHGIVTFMTTQAWVLGPAVIALILLYRRLVKTWTGRGRVVADRYPPFSFYKLRAGCAFLLAVVEQARMGEALNTGLLERMSRVGAPYERSRIEAIARYSTRGNLGQAALLAGQEFPSDDMNTIIDAMAAQEDWVEDFREFLIDWIGDVEAMVAARAQKITFVLFAVMTAIIGSIVLTVFEISQSVT